MEQYLNFNRMKALYILILRSLLRKFDIGANKRQSIFYTIAGIGSRQISTKNHPPLRTGQTSGLDSVQIGTIRKILSSWWLLFKLTHSRMSVGYHEWPGVLFIGVWRASACSPGRELCCLDGETGNRACAKSPFCYWCSSDSLGWNWRKSHWHIQESRPNAEKLLRLKSSHLLSRLTCIFSHVVGIFHVVYRDGKKYSSELSWKTCLRRHTNEIVFLLLSLTDLQSLYNWLSILALVIWQKKHKKRQRTHQLYIFSNVRDIYLITENNCSKKGTDC